MSAVYDSDELVEVLLPRAGAAVAVLRGEHDLATAEELEGQLDGLLDGNDLLVVDLSEASFIDSSTLGVFVRVNNAARAKDAHFRLQLGEANMVHRVLEITGLLHVLDSAPTREAALLLAADASANPPS